MATIAAASGTIVDINTAMSSAVDGDTVTVPAGTWTWTGSVSPALAITKAITLKGAGIGNTIIRDGLTGAENRMMLITLVADKVTRLTGFEFNNNGRTAQSFGGIFQIVGQGGGSAQDGRRVRIDHCKFDHLRGLAIWISRAYGVMDHCNLYGTTNMWYMYHPTDYPYADDRWAEGPDWGSENFFFIENCTFERTSASPGAGTDAYCGARYVARHNTMTKAHFDAHGTESAQRARGTRAIEIYNNTGIGSFAGANFVNLRSGSALVWGNSFEVAGTKPITAVNERCLDALNPFGAADGVNYWDDNDVGNPQATYTATQGAADGGAAKTVKVTGAGWVDDQWKGYTLRKLKAPGNREITAVDATNDILTIPGHGLLVADIIIIHNNLGSTPHLQGIYTVKQIVDADNIKISTSSASSVYGGGGTVLNITVAGSGGYVTCISHWDPASGASGASVAERVYNACITGNTSDTITFAAALVFPTQDMIFQAGDEFELNIINQVFDQPGVGYGTNFAGVTAAVPHIPFSQVPDPIYVWDNTAAGVPVGMTDPHRAEYQLQIRGGVHFFNSEYSYTPFTYPHPLVTDEESSEEPVVSGDKTRLRVRR